MSLKNINKYKKIEESSLSKIWKYTKEHSCGCISGWRHENTYKTNKQNNKEILSVLMHKKYSVTSIQGSYIENHESEAKSKPVSEMAFFVVNIGVDGDDGGQLEEDLVKLGLYFKQESILSIRNGEGFLVGTSKNDKVSPSYKEKISVGTAKYGKVISDYFSKIGARPFAFTSEGIDGPCNIMSKWARSEYAKKIIEKIEKLLKEIS